jgi:hypothetical protein
VSTRGFWTGEERTVVIGDPEAGEGGANIRRANLRTVTPFLLFPDADYA